MTEGQRILRRAYAHIACGNGPRMNTAHPRYPWSGAEQHDVAQVCKAAYLEIEAENPPNENLDPTIGSPEYNEVMA